MKHESGNEVLGAKHILDKCGTARLDDRILLIVDKNTRAMCRYFEEASSTLGLHLTVVSIPIGENHGEEPPEDVADQMSSFSLVVALTSFSLAHSSARLKASAAGARFLSLPQYSRSLLSDKMIRVDYRALAPTVRTVSNLFTLGSSVHLSSRAGTNLVIDIEGRRGNFCPAFVEKPGELGSPPDAEANVSPVETGANGVAVVDGSITHPSIGLLESPVRILFRAGRAVDFSSADPVTEEGVRALFESGESNRRVLGEVGVGLNPSATLTGTMLSDEGTLGTVHLGLGSNYFVGGENQVDFHLDFVIREASIRVDNTTILENGTLVV